MKSPVSVGTLLDDLPVFKTTLLEVMRHPMEDRIVTIARARLTVEFPASLMLVASMNPCPCGYYNHPDKDCSCAPGFVQRYLNKISGPLLDRIDIHVEAVPATFREISNMTSSEKSEVIRERVINARKIQEERFAESMGIYCNAQMTSKQLRTICRIDN